MPQSDSERRDPIVFYVADANNGHHAWRNNDDTTCRESDCVRSLRTGEALDINTFKGTWGRGGSEVAASDLNDSPVSPRLQSTWIVTKQDFPKRGRL